MELSGRVTKPVSKRGRKSLGRDRREARVLAMKILFEADLTPHDALDVLFRELGDDSVAEDQQRYCETLVRGVVSELESIDRQIGEAAPAFPVDQLPAVDRNVLRVAVYELTMNPEVPTKAAINEAVELAKLFGGDNSSRFVNGVLGSILAVGGDHEEGHA